MTVAEDAALQLFDEIMHDNAQPYRDQSTLEMVCRYVRTHPREIPHGVDIDDVCVMAAKLVKSARD